MRCVWYLLNGIYSLLCSAFGLIDGYPNYFFGEDKNLYRITARGELRRNPRHLKGYTLGYVLKIGPPKRPLL